MLHVTEGGGEREGVRDLVEGERVSRKIMIITVVGKKEGKKEEQEEI